MSVSSARLLQSRRIIKRNIETKRLQSKGAIHCARLEVQQAEMAGQVSGDGAFSRTGWPVNGYNKVSLEAFARGFRPHSSALLRPLLAAAVKEPFAACPRASGCGVRSVRAAALACSRASVLAGRGGLGNRLHALAISIPLAPCGPGRFAVTVCAVGAGGVRSRSLTAFHWCRAPKRGCRWTCHSFGARVRRQRAEIHSASAELEAMLSRSGMLRPTGMLSRDARTNSDARMKLAALMNRSAPMNWAVHRTSARRTSIRSRFSGPARTCGLAIVSIRSRTAEVRPGGF